MITLESLAVADALAFSLTISQDRAARIVRQALAPEIQTPAPWAVVKGGWRQGGVENIPRGLCFNFDLAIRTAHGFYEWETVEAGAADVAAMNGGLLRILPMLPDRRGESVTYDWPWLCSNGGVASVTPYNWSEVRDYKPSWDTWHELMEKLLALCKRHCFQLVIPILDGGPRSANNLEGVHGIPLWSPYFLMDERVRNYLSGAFTEMIAPYRGNPWIFGWTLFNEPHNLWRWMMIGESPRRAYSADPYLYFCQWAHDAMREAGATGLLTDGLWGGDTVGWLDRKDGYAKYQSISHDPRWPWDYLDDHQYNHSVEQMDGNLNWMRSHTRADKPIFVSEAGFLTAARPESEEAAALQLETLMLGLVNARPDFAGCLWGAGYYPTDPLTHPDPLLQINPNSSIGYRAAAVLKNWWV